MAAALNVLAGRKGRKIAVLGDMLELGVSAHPEHYKLGRIAAVTVVVGVVVVVIVSIIQKNLRPYFQPEPIFKGNLIVFLLNSGLG